MAHRGVETAREVGEGKDKHEREDTLREFRKCAMALHNVLSQDGPVDEAEFLIIENRFQVLEMAYHLWKQRGLSSDEAGAISHKLETFRRSMDRQGPFVFR